LSCVVASILGLVVAFQSFFIRPQPGAVLAASAPVDFLGIVLLVALFVVAPINAVFAAGDAAASGRRPPWLAYHLAVIGAAVIASAHRTDIFLLGWETVILASVVLTRPSVEGAHSFGRVRLLALHSSLLPLLGLLAIRSRSAQSLGWSAFLPATAPRNALLMLLLIAFVLHVLATRHVAGAGGAETPSGAFAQTLGLLLAAFILFRFYPMLGPPKLWWGIAFIGTGAVIAILAGAQIARATRLTPLASSIAFTHSGVIAIATGAALVGVVAPHPVLALLSSAGALMHMLNQALFGSLLVLGACAVRRVTGTDELERLGGLLRRMPDTATTFLIGGAAASGAPGTNAFGSLLLVIVGGALAAVRMPRGSGWTVWLALVLLTGATFVSSRAVRRAVSAVFLGQARSPEAEAAHDVGSPMRVPLHTLAIFCGVLGVFPMLGFVLVAPASIQLVSAMQAARTDALDTAFQVLRGLMVVGIASWSVLAATFALRARARRARLRRASTPAQ
jgi:hydrogenase-4 component B